MSTPEDGQPQESDAPGEVPVTDLPHRLALLGMVVTPLALALLVYGVLKTLNG
ncbi:MAG: hypothetical protein JSU98_02530 [Gemmatimonadales bacterium]|jgi:hypothetical protein|nr:MAG: hypothetical protein JSU98_02530 [Gemmatimonadales bacterium]